MIKIAWVLVLASLLVLASGAAFAITIEVGPTTPDEEWNDQWWSDCCLYLDIDWSRDAGYPNSWAMGGDGPTDPLVDQKIKNYTNAKWTDWHIIVHGGIIRQDGSAFIRKLNGAFWDLSYNIDPVPGGGSSLTGIANPADPNSWVPKNSTLWVHFVYDAIPGAQVSIEQWPTIDFIPEPSSIAALGMGLAALGFSLRRRRC